MKKRNKTLKKLLGKKLNNTRTLSADMQSELSEWMKMSNNFKGKRFHPIVRNNKYIIVDKQGKQFTSFSTNSALFACETCDNFNLGRYRAYLKNYKAEDPYDDGSNGATRYFAGL